jgi:hypothetical protein
VAQLLRELIDLVDEPAPELATFVIEPTSRDDPVPFKRHPRCHTIPALEASRR